MTIIATHPVAPEDIMALLDGELSHKEAAAVAAHLESCANCAALAEDLRGVSRSLHLWDVAPVSQELATSVEESILSQPVPPRVSKLFGWKLWTGFGVCAAAMLIFAGGAERQHSARTERFSLALAPAKSNKVDELTELQPQSPPVPSSAQTSPSAFYADAPATDVAPTTGIVAGKPAAPAIKAPQQITSPMISRAVDLDVVVSSVVKARTSIDAILARHQGYAADLNETDAIDSHALVASLRIPASQLDSAVAEFKNLGHVNKEEQKGEDVSQQHEDLIARLKNARETEERFRDILEHHTGKMEDILEVEQEIARVRGEIEGMEAEQQALEHRVTYATVELLVVDQSAPQDAIETPSVRFRHAITTGWHNATSTVFGIILFFAEDGPSILVWLVILCVPGYFMWRRYKRIRAKV